MYWMNTTDQLARSSEICCSQLLSCVLTHLHMRISEMQNSFILNELLKIGISQQYKRRKEGLLRAKSELAQ